jgi:hypothetical protein
VSSLIVYPAAEPATARPMTRAFPQPLRLWLPFAQASTGSGQASTHVFAAEQIFGLAQSASLRHSTHWLVAPSSRQRGVAPVHAAQPLPQAASVLHSTQAPPAHWLYGPQELPLHTQLDPLQEGVVPEQATHDGPHRWASLHAAQVLALHQLPAPHWASIAQSTQAVLDALHTSPVAAQFEHAAPQCWSSLHAAHAPPLHHLPAGQSGDVWHSMQPPFTQPWAQASSV